MTLDELTQAIAGAMERDLELWGLGMALSPSETLEAQNDRRALLAVIDQLLPDAQRYRTRRAEFVDAFGEPPHLYDAESDALTKLRHVQRKAIDRAIEGEKK